VKILVLQGESDRAEENELLGEFVLTGLRRRPRGEVEIEVTFHISADGIVSRPPAISRPASSSRSRSPRPAA
jgi:molecular chaperone DnaK